VLFGPNTGTVRSSTTTRLEVQVPNGQPSGPTTVTVNGSNARPFITAERIKAPGPHNPPKCCDCPSCCPSNPCTEPGAHLGSLYGGKSGDIYGQRGEYFQYL